MTPLVGAVTGAAMGLAWHVAHRAGTSQKVWLFGAAIGAGVLPGAFHSLLAGQVQDDDTGPTRLLFLGLTVVSPIAAGLVLTRRLVPALAMGIAGFLTTASIIQFSIGLELWGRFGVFVRTQVATFTAGGSLLQRWYARWRTGRAAPAVPGTSEPAYRRIETGRPGVSPGEASSEGESGASAAYVNTYV